MKQWSASCFASCSVVLILVCLGACARQVRRHPLDPTSISPRETHLTALYKVKWSQRHTVRRARLAVAWGAGEGLRIEILGPLGGSRAVLIFNNERGALLLDPRRRRYLPFETGRDAVWQVTGLGLDPELIPLFLFGDLGYAPWLDCQSTGANPATGSCFDPGSRSRVTLDRDGGGEILFETGAHIQFRRLEPFRGVNSLIPRLELRDLTEGVRVELILKDFSFEPPERGLFSILPPRGFLPERDERSFPSLREEIR